MFKTINGGILPKRFSKYSASFDVYSNEDKVIGTGCTELIGLGIAIDTEAFWERCEWYEQHTAHRTYLELHIDDRLVEKGLIAPPKIVNLDCVDEIKMAVHNPIKYYKNFKKFKPDGDQGAPIILISGLIAKISFNISITGWSFAKLNSLRSSSV